MSVEGYLPQDEHFDTRVVHSGLNEMTVPDGAIVPPISLSSTYKMKPGGEWDVSLMTARAVAHGTGAAAFIVATRESCMLLLF